jgi:ribose-phosphate pyrophosphokinase
MYVSINYQEIIPEGIIPAKYQIKEFPSGEFSFALLEDISGKEIEVFHSFRPGRLHDDIFIMQAVCHTLHQNKARSINYTAPFIPYARQDKKQEGLFHGINFIAQTIDQCNIAKLTTTDLHSLKLENILRTKVEHKSMIPVFIKDIQKRFPAPSTLCIFPDQGSSKRYTTLFSENKMQTYQIKKDRIGEKIQMSISTNLPPTAHAVIIDDIIDTGGTILEATKLISSKCANIHVYATHGLFSNNAISKLDQSTIQTITIGKHIVQPQEIIQNTKIRTLLSQP